MSGWIKLHRKIRTHWVYDNPEYLKAWITILLEVNHADTKTLIGGFLLECRRGEKLYSMETWARTFGKGWTRQKVRTFFSLLQKEKMINHFSEYKTTRLTVCNYDTYQIQQPADNQQNNHEITSKQPADNQQITTIEEVKEREEEKEPFSARGNHSQQIQEHLKLLSDEQVSLWTDWLDARNEIHGPLPIASQLQNIETLIRLPKNRWTTELELAVKGPYKGIWDTRNGEESNDIPDDF